MKNTKMSNTVNNMMRIRREKYHDIIHLSDLPQDHQMVIDAKESLKHINELAAIYYTTMNRLEEDFCKNGFLTTDDFVEMIQVTSSLMET